MQDYAVIIGWNGNFICSHVQHRLGRAARLLLGYKKGFLLILLSFKAGPSNYTATPKISNFEGSGNMWFLGFSGYLWHMISKMKNFNICRENFTKTNVSDEF